MKVVICGAGVVGSNIARYLATETNDVTVVDQSPELIQQLSESLDVTGLVGHASQPDVLERAGIEDADMIIAVTFTDEVNMIACQVAHSLFGVPTKIARIRSQSYLQPKWAKMFTRDHLPIDVVISPEIEIARAVTRRLEVPGATEVIPLSDDKVRLIGVRVTEETPLINTPLRQLTSLFPEMQIIIVGIKRGDTSIVPHAEDEMYPGDDVYFVIASDQCERAMAAFGHEEPETRRAVIFGGGNIGLFLAQELERVHSEISVKIIELNRQRAKVVSAELKNAVVINGNILEPDILYESGVDKSETVIAVTEDDETNILASLLAKKCGAQRAITLVNKSTYNPLMGPLGVDVVVNPRSITVSQILSHVRRGRVHAAYSVQENFGELIEADAMETSILVDKPLKEVDLPSGARVGAIIRDGQVIVPRPQTVIQGGDRIILFAATEAVRKVEKLFSVRLEYF
ncbi:MAG: Trk system potassium transporter TrkA [Rhodospirillaceae bacterium]|nr:Trk system potassium transporter TrkA [Rhodospirillaceae bacterium]